MVLCHRARAYIKTYEVHMYIIRVVLFTMHTQTSTHKHTQKKNTCIRGHAHTHARTTRTNARGNKTVRASPCYVLLPIVWWFVNVYVYIIHTYVIIHNMHTSYGVRIR